MKSETCSRCGEEVRWGWRHGREAWWHREDADHPPLFGRTSFQTDWAEVERQRHVVRYYDDGTPYTTAEHEHRKKGKAARERLEGDADGEYQPDPIPEPEVRSTRIDVGDPRLPRGAKRILLLAREHGWEAWATYARGPLTHGTTGKLLRIVDSVILRARLDEAGLIAVASWETDAKGAPKFKSAGLGTKNYEDRKIYIRPANSDQLVAWLKREDPDQ